MSEVRRSVLMPSFVLQNALLLKGLPVDKLSQPGLIYKAGREQEALVPDQPSRASLSKDAIQLGVSLKHLRRYPWRAAEMISPRVSLLITADLGAIPLEGTEQM